MEAGKGRNGREKRLYEASLVGDVNSLNQLMREDALTLARVCVTCFNETPLHVAAMLGHLDFVKALLSYKADLAAELNSQGFSPLHLASANGRVEIVKVLMSVNSDVCLLRDEDGMTPLHLAVIKGRDDIVQELVQARPEVVRYTVDRGETLLHLAVKHNRIGSLKLLVELDRDDFVNVKDDDGNTVLHTATSLKQTEMVKYLLGKTRVKVNAVNELGLTALDISDNIPRDLKIMEIRESLQNAGALRARKLPESANSKYQVAELAEISQLTTNSKSAAQALDAPTNGKMALPGTQSISKKKNKTKEEQWVQRKRDFLMVAASVTAAITYLAAVSPPGGTWDRDSTANDSYSFRAGRAIWLYTNVSQYNDFYICNTVAFVSSLSIIFLLVSGLPLKRKIFTYILMAIMWATITSMAFSYLGILLDVSSIEADPHSYETFLYLGISMLAWMCLLGLVFVANCIRLIVWIVRKVGKNRKKRLTANRKEEALV